MDGASSGISHDERSDAYDPLAHGGRGRPQSFTVADRLGFLPVLGVAATTGEVTAVLGGRRAWGAIVEDGRLRRCSATNQRWNRNVYTLLIVPPSEGRLNRLTPAHVAPRSQQAAD